MAMVGFQCDLGGVGGTEFQTALVASLPFLSGAPLGGAASQVSVSRLGRLSPRLGDADCLSPRQNLVPLGEEPQTHRGRQPHPSPDLSGSSCPSAGHEQKRCGNPFVFRLGAGVVGDLTRASDGDGEKNPCLIALPQRPRGHRLPDGQTVREGSAMGKRRMFRRRLVDACQPTDPSFADFGENFLAHPPKGQRLDGNDRRCRSLSVRLASNFAHRRHIAR